MTAAGWPRIPDLPGVLAYGATPAEAVAQRRPSRHGPWPIAWNARRGGPGTGRGRPVRGAGVSIWPSSRTRQVLAALLRIGWRVKFSSGQHLSLGPGAERLGRRDVRLQPRWRRDRPAHAPPVDRRSGQWAPTGPKGTGPRADVGRKGTTGPKRTFLDLVVDLHSRATLQAGGTAGGSCDLCKRVRPRRVRHAELSSRPSLSRRDIGSSATAPRSPGHRPGAHPRQECRDSLQGSDRPDPYRTAALGRLCEASPRGGGDPRDGRRRK